MRTLRLAAGQASLRERDEHGVGVAALEVLEGLRQLRLRGLDDEVPGLGHVRWAAGEDLEEDAAKGEDVGTLIHLGELAAGLRRELRDALATLARETTTAAIIMATKLVRREVAQEPEVLVRAIETVLYKAAAGCPLSVTVHPEDAAWLEAAPAIR